MAKQLLNVRLDQEDAQLVKKLRSRGISISDVVRRALREEAKRVQPDALDAKKLLEELFERYPDPPGWRPPPLPPLSDGRAISAFIRDKLKTKRP